MPQESPELTAPKGPSFESKPGKLIAPTDQYDISFQIAGDWFKCWICLIFARVSHRINSGWPVLHCQTLDWSRVCSFIYKFSFICVPILMKSLVFGNWEQQDKHQRNFTCILPAIDTHSGHLYILYDIISDSSRTYFFSGLFIAFASLKQWDLLSDVFSGSNQCSDIVLPQVSKPPWIKNRHSLCEWNHLTLLMDFYSILPLLV